MHLQTQQMIVIAGFLVAGLSASFGLPFQALMYLWTVIYAARDPVEFTFITFLYIFILLFAQFRRASK